MGHGVALAEDVKSGIDLVLAPPWTVRDGLVVPETKDVTLKDGAVLLDATYMYADMADSTGLAQSYDNKMVAKVIRCYLNAATRIIRARGGAIRSFDGDRVMGIFIGDSKNTTAAKTALNISWAVLKVINPKLKEKWPSLDWTMNHGIGVDTGKAMLVRGGVHGDNDIVSVGIAPNIAAKLSEERGWSSICLSGAVHSRLNSDSKLHDGKDMWRRIGTKKYGGNNVTYYGTTYISKP